MNGKALGAGFSLWLDMTRICCALAVVIFHSSAPQIGNGWIHVNTIGVDAVMVFFVLSGLVIAYVIDNRESNLPEFAAARFGRLWSILLPALVVTFFADKIGNSIDPSPYQGWGTWISPNGPARTLLPAVFFVNELWWSPVAPLSNGPAWSIGFEFWYYALFAIAQFTRGMARNSLLALSCLIVGPRILLLLPVWLLGVGVYQAVRRWPLSEPVAWALFLLPLAALVLAYALRLNYRLDAFGLYLLGNDAARWIYVHNFLWWYVAGMAVALHYYGAANLSDRIDQALGGLRRSISVAASFTLSIYLFHFPIMLALSSALGGIAPGPLRAAIVLAGTLMACVALGLVFEPQRYRIRSMLLSLWTRGSLRRA